MKELDNIHCDFSAIDGLEKEFNAILSIRHDGKTTSFLMKKAWPAWRKGKATALLFRQVNDVNEYSIRYYLNLMKEFIDRPLNVEMRGIGGVGAVLLDKRPLFYCIPLGAKEATLKKTSFPDVAYEYFDEYEINPINKEKYLPNEYGRFQTMHSTMLKLSPDIKFYMTSNPYSAYNPLFSGWGVKTSALRLGTMQKGKNWAVWFKRIHPDLLAKIRESDPFFDEDSAYSRWAFSGSFANDRNSHVMPTMPGGYRLAIRFVFEGQRYSAFESTDYEDEERPLYYVKKGADDGKRRVTYAFDFADLVTNAVLATKDDRDRFHNLKRAMKGQDVAFDSIETEEAFKMIYDYL